MNEEIRERLTKALIAFRQAERCSAQHIVSMALQIGYETGHKEALDGFVLVKGGDLRANTQTNVSEAHPVATERSADISGIPDNPGFIVPNAEPAD